MVDVWTARVTYGVPDRLDITRKSADPVGVVFAPSWAILGPALELRKRGVKTEESWADYVELYTAEMRRSYVTHRSTWNAVLARESVTLVCFCTDANQCHRTVLAGFFGKLGARVCGEREVSR